MRWFERPFLAVDTETTGVNPFEDRVVEVAAVIVRPDGTQDFAWSTIVNPGVDIPDGAAQVHGITTDRAQAEGIDPATAITTVANTVFDFAVGKDPMPVVMYNAKFDWPLLIAEASRHDLEFPAFAPILDPLLIDKAYDRYRKGSRKLVDVAAHYGVPLGDDAHGALADAVASARVMRALVDAFPEMREFSLAEMYVRQVRAAEKQRESFVDYMRRSKDPGFDTPAGWPIPAGVAS